MTTSKKSHFVMFPWFAFGHFTPFLHLSNQLAQRGHRVSFLLPNKASIQLQTQNLHPDLITFYPLKVPAVNGLPFGAETASDLPFSSHTHLAKAFDLIRDQVEDLVVKVAPDFIFHDFSHWLPEFASSLGIITVNFIVIAAICMSQAFQRNPEEEDAFGDAEFGEGIVIDITTIKAYAPVKISRRNFSLMKKFALKTNTCLEEFLTDKFLPELSTAAYSLDEISRSQISSGFFYLCICPYAFVVHLLIRICKLQSYMYRSTGFISINVIILISRTGITFFERIEYSITKSDAVCFRTCNEIEGQYVESLRKLWNKPVFLSGPCLPEEDDSGSGLDPKWDNWLSTFRTSTVVFSALGTQIVLEKPQFQELVSGFESTGLPFLLVLKPPVGSSSIKDALPDGFEERVNGRGVVHDGWVQQSLILKHASVGCFVTHCGYGSMWESLVNKCQIVGLPFLPDQGLNAKLLAVDMKAAVAVEKDENGWVCKEKLCEAIKSVMDEVSEVGLEVRRNHLKYREMLCKEGFMCGHVDKLVEDIQEFKLNFRT